ncbi:hypothetical protein ACU8V7_18755 [Zobellia nedashkovskayae]
MAQSINMLVLHLTLVFLDCGSNYSIDFDKKEVIFSETTVINTKTNAILTMNGTVLWK